jgi:hypothetical protein
MILEIVDVLHLERRHTDLPDHAARSSAELDIMRSDQRLGQIGIVVLLRQDLMGKVEIVLIDKTAVKTFSLLVEGTIAIIRQDPVWKGLFHSTIMTVLELILNFS